MMLTDELDEHPLRSFLDGKDVHETSRKIAVFFLIYLYIVKDGPKWMRLRPAFNLNPHLLIYNGYQFGVHAVGFLLVLWTTQLGVTSWTCTALDHKDVKSFFVVYVIYVFLWAKIMECLETVIHILMKKRRHIQLIEVFRTFANFGLVHIGLKYPNNLMTFYPLIDLFVGIFIFWHNTLQSAGVNLKIRGFWDKFIFVLRLLEFCALFSHGLFIINLSTCDLPRFLSIYECLFAFLNLVMICSYYSYS